VRSLNILALEEKEEKASSKSAKTLSPFFLSQTIQPFEENKSYIK